MIDFPFDNKTYPFPNPLEVDDDGLLAYGGDLNPYRVLTAYANGIFPWYNKDEPILWWCPNPRFVLELDEFKVSKSLRKSIEKNIYEIKFDTNFTQTMIECAKIKRDGQKGTWIQNEMIETYTKIHQMGFAHSFEAYFEDKLVGGGYGIAVGNIFCGESMFAKKTDASKVALFHLVQRLKKRDFKLIDCQVFTPHLESLGAKEIGREEFLKELEVGLKVGKFF